jgi:dipeptidyl-peptidase III
MKKIIKLTILVSMIIISAIACDSSRQTTPAEPVAFKYKIDQFGDMQVLRYQLPGFELLTLKQKEFIYYLSEATLCGRDILWDQNFKYNLLIRKTIEAIIGTYNGDKEADNYKSFIIYAKRVFFANGIHHHYSNDKLKPGFTKEYFDTLVLNSDVAEMPLTQGQNIENLLSVISPIIFDETLYAKRVEQKAGADMVALSATNLYEGVTQKEVENYYASIAKEGDPRPVSYGLNSKVVKRDGRVTELVYRSGGLYGTAIDNIILWLEKAKSVAETKVQEDEIALLINYYKSGDLKIWDEYNIAWANDTKPIVDYINGFIENYADPMGMKATWEGIVDYKDLEATKRTEIITSNSQWFEDNSPIQPQYKKETVTGVAAKVINIAMLGGDCYPVSPLGINLPNADWIRKEVGSKSVTLGNITSAIDIASQGSGMLNEFAADENEQGRAVMYGSLASALHTDLHESVGHASGKLAAGTDPNALKNYASPLEEARADLFALYYIIDPKLEDLKLLPEKEVAMAEYDSYIRGGLLTQLVRIQPGKDIEQAHMRCRSTIAHWVFEKGRTDNIIEMFTRDGKTFVKINDYDKLRTLFGELLKEVQRIKSEGDFEAGKNLIENYGVKIDQKLHTEIIDRYTKLNLAPYTGFVNPILTPVIDSNGNITDITVEYVDDYLDQMMDYGKKYAFLPVIN